MVLTLFAAVPAVLAAQNIRATYHGEGSADGDVRPLRASPAHLDQYEEVRSHMNDASMSSGDLSSRDSGSARGSEAHALDESTHHRSSSSWGWEESPPQSRSNASSSSDGHSASHSKGDKKKRRSPVPVDEAQMIGALVNTFGGDTSSARSEGGHTAAEVAAPRIIYPVGMVLPTTLAALTYFFRLP